MSPPADGAPESLRRTLERRREMRGREAHGHAPPRLAEVKAWQATRLARTYADLSADPRYGRATTFVLDDLYGAKDFSGRDTAMLRIYPVMVRTLPDVAVETAALAIEVDALSEELDRRVAACLDPGPISEAGYGKAYREAGTAALRNPSVIGRCFRDMNAATQHVMVGRKTLTDAAVELLPAG